jgi:AAA15 family ATPase/GTPase
MQGHIKTLSIQNFKSIKNIQIDNFSRINLFIGKPNVGKSNLLEALSLFSIPYYKQNTNKKISNFIRLENEAELFFDGNIENEISIETNIANCSIKYTKVLKADLSKNKDAWVKGNIDWEEDKSSFWADLRKLLIEIQHPESKEKIKFTVDDKLNLKSDLKIDAEFPVKRYLFVTNVKNKKSNIPFLIPPTGTNLMAVIEQNKELKNELIIIFSEYGLTILFDKASQSLKILKKNRENDLFLIPYNSIADTLQRIIFYKSAIVSNKNSVLIFEEPEAHSFPPYIVHITQEIIHSNSNQFFISTHSPYIVNDFLENSRDDLSIFSTDLKNGETVIRQLTKDEIYDIYQYGVDLFANNESYL